MSDLVVQLTDGKFWVSLHIDKRPSEMTPQEALEVLMDLETGLDVADPEKVRNFSLAMRELLDQQEG
jgi:hypothetical protein